MKRKLLFLMALLVSTTMAWAWSGSGTSSSPYLIASVSDWNTLATNVSNGTTYSGKYFRQTASFSVSREIGTWESRPFSGTYDGNGYTITVNYTATGRYCAPFKVVSGATLKNIRTAGTINTAYQTAAGLIAGIPTSSGTVTVTNCRSSVTINSTYSGDTAHGGLIGNSRNTGKTVTLTGCVFDGKLIGSNSYNCGGLVGYNYANLTLTNCVFAPSQVSVKISDTEMTLARYNVAPTITNCYYTQTLGTAQGKKAYTITAGAGVTVSKAGSASSSYSVSNIYCYGTNKGIKYNDVIYGGSGDAVSLSLSGATKYVTTNGTLSGTTLTMTSANATINGTWNGSGQSGSPYQIANTTDWNLLAAQVNAGTTQSGKYFQQRANITVSNIVGSYGSRAFSGTYDGGGFTITANINSTGTNGAAPFAWINGATIKNFTVTGTVKGGIHCAAVVGGVAGGTITISNIKATAAVTCSSTHCGGIVGHGNSSTTTLEGCVFAGSISAKSYVGALWGWGESAAKLTIRNCLEAGTSYTATNFSPMGQSNGAPTYNITNSYYTNAASGSTSYITGGKKAYTITAATGVTVANAGSATAYSVSGITGYGTGIKYNGVLYGGSGDAVSLNLSGGSNGYLATAGTLSGTTLTMAAANTTISKQLPGGSGTSGSPYTIGSADDWNTLATNVGLGHTYSGKYIKQTANISVSTMVGTYDSKAFSGTYDGDGYTLTATVSAEDGAAPFANIDGATIKNLKTSGTSTVTRWYGAGLVGQVKGTCTITNCSSSTSIVSNHSATCNTSCGGFVGAVFAGTLNISGCVFTGSFSYTNSGVHHGAGIIGQMNSSSSNAMVTNCVFAPTSLTGVNTIYAMVGGNSDDNIARATITNCYYNSVAASACQSAEQGKQAYSITGATGVTVANAGSATTYSVSGITGYGTGIKYNDVLYGGSGDEVSLSLSGSSTGGYSSSAGTLSGSSNPYTLTMAAANTVVEEGLALSVDGDATYSPTTIVNGDFETEPWMSYTYDVWMVGVTRFDKDTPNKPDNYEYVKSLIPNGVDEGWNTTEKQVYGSGLFEYIGPGSYSAYGNPTSRHAGHNYFIEMNAHNPAVFYQDLTTYGNDVIRWTLDHGARDTPSTQSMEVEIGAPNGEATGVGDAVNANIVSTTLATYTTSGCTNPADKTLGYGEVAGNLANLTLNASANWATVTGVYMVSDGQNVTRFAFISTNSTSKGEGNLLDNITFSTLIGNLSAVENSNGSVSLRGYWGETDTSKKLMVKIGDETKAIDMTSMVEENFIITIPESTIGNAAQLEVYHQDYEAAKRTLNIVYNVTAHQDPANTSDYYSTFYDGLRKYLLPEGVEAYVGTVNNETNNLTLTKIADAGQTIPANNAVILKSATDSYSLSVSSNTPVSVGVTNDLRGVDETTTIVGSAYEDKVIYTLAAENSTLGFYKYYQQNSVPANEETRNSRTLAANKAFLPLEAEIAAGARGFVFSFDETTSLTPVPSPTGEGSIYFNLKGQRVNKPAKGLYIKDGKKVIIK